MKRLVAYISRLLAPIWFSNKLEGLKSTKYEDFLENYYETLVEPIITYDDVKDVWTNKEKSDARD